MINYYQFVIIFVFIYVIISLSYYYQSRKIKNSKKIIMY